eukprot:364368-Chlamydomonas_euryale.AAC.7
MLRHQHPTHIAHIQHPTPRQFEPPPHTHVHTPNTPHFARSNHRGAFPRATPSLDERCAASAAVAAAASGSGGGGGSGCCGPEDNTKAAVGGNGCCGPAEEAPKAAAAAGGCCGPAKEEPKAAAGGGCCGPAKEAPKAAAAAGGCCGPAKEAPAPKAVASGGCKPSIIAAETFVWIAPNVSVAAANVAAVASNHFSCSCPTFEGTLPNAWTTAAQRSKQRCWTSSRAHVACARWPLAAAASPAAAAAASAPSAAARQILASKQPGGQATKLTRSPMKVSRQIPPLLGRFWQASSQEGRQPSWQEAQ